ncbi:uncharacterized protein SOCE836_058030 [Sorangium cellulosum]|uniref:Uncharacterized protein n=2 Tax=Polyangiaceae TaxID=49 RepID=A0A4V0NGM0_SORCE|nr:uncharacterized protein SOCE836_058030 [Sorangium cellulosum]WCQ92953.1 hypothetical protein NQZ70_05699 [Sorangium sp. Soce836]
MTTEDPMDQNEPLPFGGSSSVTVGVSFRAPLGEGDTPRRAIERLLRSVGEALSAHFEGRATARLDVERATATATLRIPEPAGSTKVCDVSVTLLADELDGDGALVVVPRIRAEIYRRRGDVDWLARDASADVDRLAGEIEDALSSVSP